MLPGNVISVSDGAFFTEMTVTSTGPCFTFVLAASSVFARESRGRIPPMNRPKKNRATTAKTTNGRAPLRWGGFAFTSGFWAVSASLLIEQFPILSPVRFVRMGSQIAVHDGNKEQGGDRCQRKSANDRPAQRSV